jgi:hypothetical protein
MVGRPPSVTRRRAAKQAQPQVGIPGDRYRVDLRGRAYWIVDSQTGGLFGGPYAIGPEGRMSAQARCDQLNATTFTRRRSG